MCLLIAADSCFGGGFACPAGEAAFYDECGCGCNRAPFHEVSGQPYPADSSDWCNGPSGLLALFEATPSQLAIDAEQIYAWVPKDTASDVTLWAIDKRTKEVHVVGSAIQLSPEMVAASDKDTVTVDGISYSTSYDGELIREQTTPAGTTRTVLERRGGWDDDDYHAIIGADADAVYWLAGSLIDAHISDRDPLAIYRTCR